MIRVKRLPAPSGIYRVKGPAEREQQRVSEFYKKYPYGTLGPDGKVKTFKFAVYGSTEIKNALEQMFGGKCAYCEGRYAATQPVDVEHWRPKAAVLGPDGKLMQGYYWLASSWDNLLPSCIDCNRERNQIIKPDGTERLAGKANRFPVRGARASSPDAIGQEQPLLLNPCDLATDPAAHLEFTDEMVARPKMINQEPSPLGETSIEVYALNRSNLVKERYERYLLINKGIYTVRQLSLIIESIGDADREWRDVIEDLQSHEIAALKRFRESDQPFALMARQLIDEFLINEAGMDPSILVT